jgi:hypothetical protein
MRCCRRRTRLFDVGGATALQEDRRLDRHWRNARTLASHNPTIYKGARGGRPHSTGRGRLSTGRWARSRPEAARCRAGTAARWAALKVAGLPTGPYPIYPMYPMRRLLLALFSHPGALAACNTPVTGVVRLYDGIFRAASPQEAEAYCRKDGNPIRFLAAGRRAGGPPRQRPACCSGAIEHGTCPAPSDARQGREERGHDDGRGAVELGGCPPRRKRAARCVRSRRAACGSRQGLRPRARGRCAGRRRASITHSSTWSNGMLRKTPTMGTYL